MPSEVSMPGADQGRSRAPEEIERELTEAREQQAATAEILAAISSSPTDPRGAFEKIAASAAHLCDAYDAGIFTVEGDLLRQVAHHGPIAIPDTLPLTREVSPGRAVLDRQTVHVADLQAEADQFPDGSVRARHLGFRTILNVPLIRAGDAIGVISIRRTEVRPFSSRQASLLKTFADQAMIAIENARLFGEVQARNRDLTEALEQQTATSDILRAIASSPSDLTAILDAVAKNAGRLCDAEDIGVYQLDGEVLRAGSRYGAGPKQDIGSIAKIRGDLILGRAFLERRTIHVHDMAAELDNEYPGMRGTIERFGMRTMLATPLLSSGESIGAIIAVRYRVQPFTNQQIDLVKTFADQAVIAIENTRLLEAEKARTRELQEALEYQTATSEVLGVISRSPSELQPVLDAITTTARRISEAARASILEFKDGQFRLVAHNGSEVAGGLATLAAKVPLSVDRGNLPGRVAIERRTVHVHDIRSDPEYTYFADKESDQRRTMLCAPLMREGELIGVFVMSRDVVHPFSDNHIKLVETFADQAVIAIENARLFEELQARNTELRIALEQQTATSELLKVIGRSTFDSQPVFESLAENAVRLCEAKRSIIYRFDGQFLRAVAIHNATPGLRAFVEQNPVAPGRSGAAARAILERRTVQILDIQTDPEYSYAVRQVDPVRTVIAVPILKGDELLGLILIYRLEVRSFTESQVALLTTFADQAGIAIENARLFEEVQARNRDLTALGEVGRAVSSTLDLKVVLKTIVERAVELSNTHGGSIFYFRHDIGRFELGESTGLEADVIARFRKLDIAAGQTGLGEALASGKPLQIADITTRPSNALRDAAIEAGLRAALIVPLLSGERPLGALVLQRRHAGEFSPQVVSLMQSFADQSAIALENARLFEEIAQQSRELEIASQHKSQFVANMSHELRTPLAAILGYAELLQEGIYGTLPQESLPALTRIRSNGKHLLGLINTVLDISKIEAGQFKLNLGEYALGSIVDTVVGATESLAATKKLSFKAEVPQGLPDGHGDDQRLTQVLLNLVGNAIKFTDAGEVRIAASMGNGHFMVSISDTGPGIPAEECERVFEKFRQIDSSNTRAKGGTGLGLAIAKEIVEMHGGRIWVESALGRGSTFRMQLPVRAAAAAGSP